ASQREPNWPRFSHVFASVVKATENQDRPHKVEHHTISWMPASLDIRVIARQPEQGANLDLPATFRWIESVGARVTTWGPHEIKPELYERFLAQIRRLDSGKVLYKAMDNGF